MNFTDEQIDELSRVFPDTTQYNEGGVDYFLIPQLALPQGCSPAVADALLCPTVRDGYPSRLFFSEKIETPTSRNWNSLDVRIIERNWNGFSWKIEMGGLRLVVRQDCLCK